MPACSARSTSPEGGAKALTTRFARAAWLHVAGLQVYPDCVMGLGGGPASRGGAFSHFKYPDVCKAQLDQYFEAENGIYYQQ